MSIILLRHGLTEHNNGFYGSTDSQLTDVGFQAMLEAVSSLNFDRIVSSPLQRCAKVAQQLAQQRSCSYQILPEWQEYHFGDWETLSIQQLWDDQPKALTAFWQNPYQSTPPNAEAFDAFLQRLHKAKQHLVETSQSTCTLVITHAGVIRGLRLIAEQTSADEWLTYPVTHASVHSLCPHTGHVEPFEKL
jgi:alpha-ribazole phosphatase